MTLADQLEEVGGQHIYLYNLTAAGTVALTADKMKAAFSQCVPSADYYTDTPSGAAVERLERDGTVFLKQVRTTSFWERDPSAEVSTDDLKSKVWTRIHRRAIHTFLVDIDKGTVEVCIDRVNGENDATLADEELTGFLSALDTFLVVKDHLTPVRVSHAFAAMVADTHGEAYMNADGVETSAIAQRMSNRRRGTKLPDIRKNPDYVRAKPKGDREGLTIYWFTDQEAAVAKAKDDAEYEPDDDQDEESEGATNDGRPYVHSIITAVKRDIDRQALEHCKVYIAAKVTAKDRTHVSNRIRHFAG